MGSYILLLIDECFYFRGGLSSDEDRLGVSQFQPNKKFENNWEDQIFINNNPSITTTRVPVVDHVKQELSQKSNDFVYVHTDHHHHEELQQQQGHSRSAWSHFMPVSSPTSCITNLGSNNILDFSHNKADIERNPKPDHSSEVRDCRFLNLLLYIFFLNCVKIINL